jgi:hypothetical protein
MISKLPRHRFHQQHPLSRFELTEQPVFARWLATLKDATRKQEAHCDKLIDGKAITRLEIHIS